MASGLLITFAGHPPMASSLFPDNGLASLAGVLLAQGHGVRILDFNTVDVVQRMVSPERSSQLLAALPLLRQGADPNAVERLLQLDAAMDQDLTRVTDELVEAIAAEVLAQGSHFVGFKLWSGAGFSASVRMAAALRERFPDLRLLAGGPAVLYAEEQIYALTDVFDALVYGEGEEAIIGLARWSEGKGDLQDVPNLIIRDGDQVARTRSSWVADLESLPPPAYGPDVYPSLAAGGQIRLFVLDESRGCPMPCYFCVHRSASGAAWRVKSPGRVLTEIEELRGLYDVSTVRFAGSNTPMTFYQGFADAVLASGTDVTFSGFGDPGRLRPRRMETLARAGCRAMFFGVESFDRDDLKRLGKKLDPDKAKVAISQCIEHGLVPGASLIHPVPGQTRAAKRLNRDTVLELCSGTRSTVMLTFPALMPRTGWWAAPGEYGINLGVSRAEYQQLLATYRIRRLVPTNLWAPLPYDIDGRPFADYAGETASLHADLIAHDVVVDLQDDTVLLADALGTPLKDFFSEMQGLFFSYHGQALAGFVRRANESLRKA